MTNANNLPPTGLPIALVTHLRDRLNISTFVETGTGWGRTTSIAASLFPHVYTVNVDVQQHDKVKAKFSNRPHVRLLLGDTVDTLPVILHPLGQSIVFLDAHCVTGARGATSCPLLSEIAIVLAHRTDHVIIVDDWEHFSFPGNSERRHEWPEITRVIDALRQADFTHPPYIFEYRGDRDVRPTVLLSVPRTVKPHVEAFLYK